MAVVGAIATILTYYIVVTLFLLLLVELVHVLKILRHFHVVWQLQFLPFTALLAVQLLMILYFK